MAEEKSPEPGQAIVVNETDLPDDIVAEAVETYFVENASLAWGGPSSFQSYVVEGQGSLLARQKFRLPTNVIEEIKLARDLAERDDDVASTIGGMLQIAFGEGMQNQHTDDRTVALFDEVARNASFDGLLKEMYREYLIASSLTTVTVWTRENFKFLPHGVSRQVNQALSAPLVGVLPAEQIRVIDSDLFGTGTLAYRPASERHTNWLREFFGERTTPGRRAEMRRVDPVSATIFTGKVNVPPDADDAESLLAGDDLYTLNPRHVHRTTMPKGSWKYPRPLLTRNFPLLEAKRLLNLLDYSLLQGGTNFLVVVRKGTDQRPAIQSEIANLERVVKRASRSGVIVGDHRLSIDIITPNLDELLNPDKRKLIARKLSNGLLRVPDHLEGDDAPLAAAILGRVIGGDRRDIKRHVEGTIYRETAKRNADIFTRGSPSLWFQKIVLDETSGFTDFILKLRDRGDIPRKFAVEAGGFSYEASVNQRRRELEAGDDEIMVPGDVPFSSPQRGPQDNQPGRPRGTSRDNGRRGARRRSEVPEFRRPRRTIRRTRGETITAWYDDELAQVFRVGELTYAVLDEFAETKETGRLTKFEREAAFAEEPRRRGPVVVVPVNPDYDVEELNAVRLDEGLSIVVGKRPQDDALVAKALVFREPHYSADDAQDRALRWGFEVAVAPEEELAEAEVSLLPGGGGYLLPAFPQMGSGSVAAGPTPIVNVHIQQPDGKLIERTIERDEHGNITGFKDRIIEETREE